MRRVLTPSLESALGNLIADAQLHATRSPEQGGAQLSFMNPGGLRADLVPDGQGLVRYGQLYAVQPFGNQLVVKTFTGAQVQAVLEQQFASGSNTVQRPRVLSVSARNIPTEYELTYQLTFSVIANGKTLIDKEQISTTRDISFDEAQLLAKEREQEILSEALARDLVALVMRRLAAL